MSTSALDCPFFNILHRQIVLLLPFWIVVFKLKPHLQTSQTCILRNDIAMLITDMKITSEVGKMSGAEEMSLSTKQIPYYRFTWTTFQLFMPIKFFPVTFHLLMVHRKMEETYYFVTK